MWKTRPQREGDAYTMDLFHKDKDLKLEKINLVFITLKELYVSEAELADGVYLIEEHTGQERKSICRESKLDWAEQ